MNTNKNIEFINKTPSNYILITLDDCKWEDWRKHDYTFPGPRADGSTKTECKNLICNGNGMSPEMGNGEKIRKIESGARNGGKECSGEETQRCSEPCPGRNSST